MSTDYTRRRFLGKAGAGAAGIALFGLAGCNSTERSPSAEAAGQGPQSASSSAPQQGGAQSFRSRPDLSPPVVEVTVPARNTADGYIFVAAKNGVGGEEHPSQHGPMILDGDGRLLWMLPMSGEDDAMDFRVQRYQGEPVLTWWQGVHAGWGQGEYVVYDSSYGEVARFGAGNGYAGDHHEFLVTDRDTALIGIYSEARRDLSSLGGSANGAVMDGIVQEIDIESGEVLFEWHSLEHVGFDESYYDLSPDAEEPFDYFHLNSINVDNDDNLLIAGRRTSSVYKVDRESGEVIWRLGGTKSDFEPGEDAQFAYQHDVRRQPDGAITLFDNRGPDMDEPSRGIALDLDEEAMRATLLREYIHPDEAFGIYQGNMQTLPNANLFIGWGSAPYITEYSRDGRLLFDAQFPSEVESYRAYRSPWEGRPDEDPAMFAETGDGDEVTVYATYNGATEVAEWEVLAGPGPDGLRRVGSAPRKGFETAITVRSGEPHVGVRAKDRSGRALGSASGPVEKS